MTQEANIQSRKSVLAFLSRLVLIALSVMPPSQHGERKGSLRFPGVFHTQKSSRKINFITPSADVKPAGFNELCLFS